MSVPGAVATGSREFAKSSDDPFATARGSDSLAVGLLTRDFCDIVCGHAFAEFAE